MRVLLRSRWVGWTNEWAYCWGLPRCHGAGSQWTAHPNVLTNGITCMSHTPQVLTGTGPWHVSVCLEDHSPPPCAKPPRQQLKEAFKNGHTLTSHYWKNILSLSLYDFFWKRCELQTALMCFHGQTTHTWLNTFFSFTHKLTHTYTCSCDAVVPTTSRTTDDTDDRKNGAALTGWQAVNTLLQKRYIMKNDPQGSKAPNRWSDRCCTHLHVYSISKMYFPHSFNLKKSQDKS